jgi:hypothetical protein
MPIKLYYKNLEDQLCNIRPTPLCTISTNILKNGAGEAYGVTYQITLTGTLLPDQGSPYAFKPANVGLDDGSSSNLKPGASDIFVKYKFNRDPDNVSTPNPESYNFVGPYAAFDNSLSHAHNIAVNRPSRQYINQEHLVNAIFSKQMALKALFARDGQRMEITDWDDDSATIVCYPRLINIDFQEGVYVNRCDYTITLEADILLDANANIEEIGLLNSHPDVRPGVLDIPKTGIQEATLIQSLGGHFIQDYQESWSIESDDQQAESTNPYLPKTFRVTHNLSATGKTHFKPDPTVDVGSIKTKAWENAANFVKSRLINKTEDVSGVYPNMPGLLGSGTLNLIGGLNAYNQVRTENVDEAAGSFAVTETFLLASGASYESFNLNITSNIDAPFIDVSIDGQIKGLESLSTTGVKYLHDRGYYWPLTSGTAYHNAMEKYREISNNSNFGVGCDLYKRANNAVAVALNSQPKTITLGVNEYTGEINYSLAFDNRPTNIISGVLTEQISVNDTYPGDVFATIPVLGRDTGPVLQYMGSRTEYRRDVSINLAMDYTKVPYGQTRNPLLLKKPSVVSPTAEQIHELLIELSPANEPGVRKYFLSPPSESWSPKDGQYSLNLSWTYELDK